MCKSSVVASFRHSETVIGNLCAFRDPRLAVVDVLLCWGCEIAFGREVQKAMFTILYRGQCRRRSPPVISCNRGWSVAHPLEVMGSYEAGPGLCHNNSVRLPSRGILSLSKKASSCPSARGDGVCPRRRCDVMGKMTLHSINH